MRRRMPVPALGLVVVAMASVACQGPTMRSDQSVQITGPREGAMVGLPFRLDWTSRLRGIVPVGSRLPAGDYYAVFIDTRPLSPGQDLMALVDPQCAKVGHGCANVAYFVQENVYLTSHTSLVIQSVPPLTQHRRSSQTHTAVIVLMDSHNRRVGETFWRRTFRVMVPDQ